MSEKKIVMFNPYVNQQAAQNVFDALTHRHEDGRLWIGEGPRVREFEDALCEKFGFQYAVALNSGTAGLRLALAMAGVGPGNEVITTAMTCTATNMPILEQFAIPVFADIQYDTGNINPADIEHRITEKTKAIMCVHWGGYPCDMDELEAIAIRHGIPVIEDGAHALGATYKMKPVGTLSRYTMFSFQAIKQLTTGDGGLLTLVSEDDYNRARRLRWFAIDRRWRTTRIDGYSFWPQDEGGFKMHMNDIAASIGLGNLEDIDWILTRRREIAMRYRHAFSMVAGVGLFRCDDGMLRTSGNWLFTMHVANRDDFCRMMADHGVEVSICHIRCDEHPVFGPRRKDLHALDQYEQSYISIPLHNHLSDEDVEYVIECVKGGW